MSLLLSAPEVAAGLGLSPNTIKTHLRRVFKKTGTHRQAELARLVASMAKMTYNGSQEP
jgi:DNA-binding CsgD family transcriptional regulator